ncbi:PIG-L deacetylase family protein [Chloroflexota bacterium]
MEKADVLVISPHPDDAEFGVAGTVAKWTAEGKKVVYAVVTDGSKGTSDTKITPAELMAKREQEQLDAAKLLGVSKVEFLRYPDQMLEDTPALRLNIASLIRRYSPNIVVSADPYRKYLWHRDHRITGQVVLDAVFPIARDYHASPELISEGLLPHRVAEVWLWGSEDINYRSDISQTFEKKIAALKCHKSQVEGLKNSGVENRLQRRHRSMAEGHTFEYAEAFHVVKMPS